jgi:hypothetical protein
MSSFYDIRLAFGAEPTGSNWFQIYADPFTGKDNSGDGGTGNSADLNYFYVDQNFDGDIAINSVGTTAANIWIDYDQALVSVNNIITGNYFNSWHSQTIQNGRIKSTGYNLPVARSTGKGDFGRIKLKMLKPSEPNYGTGSPAVLDINTGQIGKTTESNIAYNGQDFLDSAEDFKFHVWADTKKPYAKNPLPVNGATNIAVDSPYSFDLRDSLKGETDDSGVGTGVNINTPGEDITFNSSSLKQNAAYACSGIWGSNLCAVTVNPPVITAFPGDKRKWDYDTTYTVKVSGYKDLASSNQSQLGDANGPNMMDPKTFTFKTAPDTIAPRLLNVLPASGSIDNPNNAIISFDVLDRQTYPNGMSGSGIKADSCRVDVSSASFHLKTFKSGDAGVTVTDVDYGKRFVIDTVPDFVAGDNVNVRIYDCADMAGNKIIENAFTFKTLVLDTDGDGIPDSTDNCPLIANPQQKDIDHDGIGDVCDTDNDNDGILDTVDNCPLVPNADQKNTTLELHNLYISDPVKYAQYKDIVPSTLGDACNPDIDGDGILNAVDNCPVVPNTDQKDMDGDGIGDACDPDIDGDGLLNAVDNCPLVVNPLQEDLDKDGIGDLCDPDVDGDGILNTVDNCPLVANPGQEDKDKNGIGDACDIKAGSIDFNITAKPQKRVVIGGKSDLSLDGILRFYSPITKKMVFEDTVSLKKDGTNVYKSKDIAIGDYEIGIKGTNNLTKIIRNITIGNKTTTIDLDYTFGGIFELFAGDIYSDDIVNSFDLATMLKTYGSKNGGTADLTRDGNVNAPDIALLILNYFKKGEIF